MKQYLIKPGDTLSVLARNFGTSIREILRANPRIKNPDLIFAGTFLYLPGTETPAPKAAATPSAPPPAPPQPPEDRFDLKLVDETDYADSKVFYYIDRALKMADGLKSPPAENIVERNYLAWIYLRAVRRLGEADDEDEQAVFDKFGIVPPRVEGAPSSMCLADAEHYMYMRQLVSGTGDSTASALPFGYQGRKMLPNRQKLKTSRFPVLPPSFHGLEWGLRGYSDGMKDYQKANPGSSGHLGEAWKDNKELIKGSYKMY
jgi:LysM repeat protein